MAYQMVSYGSSGTAVKELQTLLNSQGYALDVDGVFGAKTRTAVKNYQKKEQSEAGWHRGRGDLGKFT